MVNIGKQLGQKIAYNIEKFIQIKDNIYSLHSKVNKSLKKVKETARDGVSQFKSIEYTEKNHDFLQYVLQEAAGVSAYKAEEIENIKGKMAMLNLNSKDKENMVSSTSCSIIIEFKFAMIFQIKVKSLISLPFNCIFFFLFQDPQTSSGKH